MSGSIYLGAIVQGRYDILCPPTTAWDVHKAWPKSSLHWVDDAGHSASVSFYIGRRADCGELANTIRNPGRLRSLPKFATSWRGYKSHVLNAPAYELR